jgi:hypothetical protein
MGPQKMVDQLQTTVALPAATNFAVNATTSHALRHVAFPRILFESKQGKTDLPAAYADTVLLFPLY